VTLRQSSVTAKMNTYLNLANHSPEPERNSDSCNHKRQKQLSSSRHHRKRKEVVCNGHNNNNGLDKQLARLLADTKARVKTGIRGFTKTFGWKDVKTLKLEFKNIFKKQMIFYALNPEMGQFSLYDWYFSSYYCPNRYCFHALRTGCSIILCTLINEAISQLSVDQMSSSFAYWNRHLTLFDSWLSVDDLRKCSKIVRA
jgi:hypothetical protein